MKLAVSGKGGAGKTTLAALAVAELLRRGVNVTAIDADPNPTLAPCLGITTMPTPLLEMSDEIEARVGSGIIRLNPRVDDLADKIAVGQDGLQLIVAGGPVRGGAGCACPQSTLLRQLLEHVVVATDEAVIIDLEAGLEHLGRRTAHAADALIIVVDPTNSSAETAQRIARLAADINLRRVVLVANRIVDPTDVDFIKERLPGLELVGEIPFSTDVMAAERDRRPLVELGGPAAAAVARMLDVLVAEGPVTEAAEPPEEVMS
ncbi:MAG: AAA family ATPase [Chloroflexota bacterium]|jgi:CO dehydrogenase maturation factor